MMSLRALLVVIVSLAMVSATHFGRWPGIAPDGAPTVAASDLGDSSGSPKINVVAAQDNGNGNGNDNGGDDDDDGGNGNDNGDDDDDNGGDDDDDGDDNDNGDDDDDDGIRAPVGESRTGTTKCFDVQEVGLVQRAIGEGDVTVSVPPDSGFASITRLSLRQVDRAAVPAPPSGSFLDALIWSIDAQSGCAGPPITQLSGGVNLGITYRVPADKSKLQIVYLQGGQWTNVTTFPDPAAGNPYISATINNGGTYAVVQLP